MQKKEHENTEISDRILKLIDALGVNPNAFARTLGYNRSQTVYDILKGKSAPSFDFFQKLAKSEYSAYINIDWVLTGRGEILRCDFLQNEGELLSTEEKKLLTKTPNFLTNSKGKEVGKKLGKKRKLQNSLPIKEYPKGEENIEGNIADMPANCNGIKVQETSSSQETEPMTSTGIPLSQVKAKVYATRSDEEIDQTISAMMERQLMEMYEEGRIYSRKAVEQLVTSLQESNQKLLAENAELKAEIRRMQLKPSDQHGPDAEPKK